MLRIKHCLPSFGVALAAFAATSAAGQYPLEEETDREYAMDLVQLSPDRDWERVWAGKDRGVSLAMGSLNVRQWYIEEHVKFAADFASWFRMDYRYDRREGLEPLWDERQRHEFELEGRVWRWVWLGFRTDPAFWKREADAGLSARFLYDRNRRLEFRYTAIDFDNNYSFERSQYDEGYEELFRIPPRRYEAAGAWLWPWGLRLAGEGFIRTPSAKYYTYFYGQQPDWARRYAERYGAFEIWKTLPANVEVYYKGTANAWEDTRRFTDPLGNAGGPGDAHDARLTLDTHGVGAYFQPSGRHRIRGGVERRTQSRRVRYAAAPGESYDYDKSEWVYHVFWRVRTWRELYLETGYLGQRSRTDTTKISNDYYERKVLHDSRVPVSLEYKFGENYAFKMASGVDLDPRDWGQFLIYDKAYAYLIACF